MRGWCDGACTGADLEPLLVPSLSWLWLQMEGTAERRGDLDLTDGRVTVTVPASPAERAAAGSLLGGRPLGAARTRSVDLADLTARLRKTRGPQLTPGAVAAHALSRPLAPLFRAQRARTEKDSALRRILDGWVAEDHGQSWWQRFGTTSPDDAWELLRSAGWVADLRKQPDAVRLLTDVLAVLAALPAGDGGTDRRTLAESVLDDPHGLDDDRPVARFAARFLTATGVVPRSPRRRRDIWEAVGVAYDDLTGGLLVTGIIPDGWSIPAGAVVTLPPRELVDVDWPPPDRTGDPVFVTENPSVLAALADAVRAGDVVGVRMICTAGTPSVSEVAALGRLAGIGWQLYVRADFDPAGLAHMRAFMDGIPGALPWRMSAGDYKDAVRRSPMGPSIDSRRIAESPWDPDLASAMAVQGVAGSEESLLPLLLSDMRRSTAEPETGGGTVHGFGQ